MSSHGRSLFLFSLFTVVAMVALTFVYVYRATITATVRAYEHQLTVCENILNEAECRTKADVCQGIYIADAQGLSFKRCQSISAQAAVDQVATEKLCQATGGEWFTNELGAFCLCQSAGANMRFNRQTGCQPQNF